MLKEKIPDIPSVSGKTCVDNTGCMSEIPYVNNSPGHSYVPEDYHGSKDLGINACRMGKMLFAVFPVQEILLQQHLKKFKQKLKKKGMMYYVI